MSVYDILDKIKRGNPRLEWQDRMLHKIPDAESVSSRQEYILEQVKGKTVLDVGCAGTDGKCTLFKKIMVAALKAYGIDKTDCGLPNTKVLDIDELQSAFHPTGVTTIDTLPYAEKDIDLIICSEILEHLSRPGLLLDNLYPFPNAELLITVPNAYSSNAFKQLQKGYECVNDDHVCWYSWRTLKTLIERSGYTVTKFLWYNGAPLFSEGLIMHCERKANE